MGYIGRRIDYNQSIKTVADRVNEMMPWLESLVNETKPYVAQIAQRTTPVTSLIEPTNDLQEGLIWFNPEKEEVKMYIAGQFRTMGTNGTTPEPQPGTGSKDKVRYHDTVSNMLADVELEKGSVVITRGYYVKNDGGAATYLIEDVERGLETGPTWSLKITGKNLFANIQNRDSVTYRMFGAKLDGVSDDGPTMRLCHNYAHTIYTKDQTGRIKQYTCKVENHSGTIYKKDTVAINVYTNVDLSGSTLIVDNSNATWFGLFVWGDVNVDYFSLELTDEQKSHLHEGSFHFPMTDNSIPSNIAIQLSEEPYSARDDVGFSYTVGRKELLIHDMFGICASPLTSDWRNAGGRDIKCPVTNLDTGVTTVERFTSKFQASFTHIPNQHLTFVGCDVMLNVSNDKYVSVLWVKRHNCTVRDFVFRPHRNSLRNPVFKNSMIYLWDSYNVTVQNIQGFNGAGRNDASTGFVATSGYMLRMSNCSDVLVRDCRLLGYWGATAMNSTKNVRFERCQLNRIDSHDYISNLFVDDCILYHHGLQVGHGTGMLSITNCTQYVEPVPDLSYTNHLLELNTTYGRVFSGRVHIDNVKVVVKKGTKEYVIIQGSFWEKAVAITEKYGLPEITVSNFQLDAEEIEELVYLEIGGKRNATTSQEPPNHIKGIAIDNTVRWKYLGREKQWVADNTVTKGDIMKSFNNYYEAQNDGRLGSVPPTHTSGIISNGTVVLKALGSKLMWKARYNYSEGDIMIIPTGSVYAPKVYRCIQSGLSNGNMPVHTVGLATDNELTWEYVGETSKIALSFEPGKTYYPGELIQTSIGLFRCVNNGVAGIEQPTNNGWFKNTTSGTLTLQYVGGAWEPAKWFDINSYCDARGKLYRVSGHYGTTSGILPEENNGTANDGDIIWEDAGLTNSVAVWAPETKFSKGTKLLTDTDLYIVEDGVTGTSNPQFTSGTGTDGTVALEFIGISHVWQPSHQYIIGDMVHNGAKIYKCIQAGESASSGWGPNVESGNLEDNKVVWTTMTNAGVYRKNSVPAPEGQYIIVADERIYRVIQGYTGIEPPVHNTGTVVNGILNLTWLGRADTVSWKPKSSFNLGDEVIVNGRSYVCISDGVLSLGRRMLFDNIDTNLDNVSVVKFRAGTDVKTRMKDNRFEVIVRDCHGVDETDNPVDWFGRVDNPKPTKFVVK